MDRRLLPNVASLAAAFFLVALSSLSAPELSSAQDAGADRFGDMEARDIGPAAMSGRIAAIEGVPGRHRTDQRQPLVTQPEGGARRAVGGV